MVVVLSVVLCLVIVGRYVVLLWFVVLGVGESVFGVQVVEFVDDLFGQGQVLYGLVEVGYFEVVGCVEVVLVFVLYVFGFGGQSGVILVWFLGYVVIVYDVVLIFDEEVVYVFVVVLVLVLQLVDVCGYVDYGVGEVVEKGGQFVYVVFE